MFVQTYPPSPFAPVEKAEHKKNYSCERSNNNAQQGKRANWHGKQLRNNKAIELKAKRKSMKENFQGERLARKMSS